MALEAVFLIIALGLFIAAVFAPPAQVRLIAAGLAFMAAAFLAPII